MEASRPFGTFSRIFKHLLVLFTKPVPPVAVRPRIAMPAPVSVPEAVAPPPAAEAAAPGPVAPVAVRAAVVPPETPESPPVSLKPQRTLAEVRADLARLRAQSRERQAQARLARPDVTFPATDFMAYDPSAQAPRDDGADAGESFAPTAYLDFTVLKSR